jgi:hypothetical protein
LLFLLPIVTAAWGVPGAAAALLGLELVALAARWAALVGPTRPAAETTGAAGTRKAIAAERVRQSLTRAGSCGQKTLPEIVTRPDGTLP